MSKINLQDVDVISVLNELGITYNTAGKNVSKGWIGTNCPFCDDPSNHLGINLDKKTCNCFRCSQGRTNFAVYIKEVTGYIWKDVIKLLEDCSSKPFFERKWLSKPLEKDKTKSTIQMPTEVKEMLLGHKQYLLQRGFNPTEIENQFHVLGAPAYGYFAYRIVIPVYENRRLVNITGRDITSKADLRYLSLPNEEAVIPIKDCVYNLDAPKKRKFIVEGPIDTWSFGNYGLGMFGIVYTKQQLEKIYRLDLEKTVVCFDDEAEREADKLASELSTFVPEVDVMFLNKDDPGSLTRKESYQIIQKYLL